MSRDPHSIHALPQTPAQTPVETLVETLASAPRAPLLRGMFGGLVILAAGLSAGIAMGLGARPAEARSQADVVQADILPGWQQADGSRMTALRIDLAQGWKTYWRAPGDAGIPPSFDWSGSENLRGLRYHWPRPVVFDTNGMQTIGYRNQLVLPIEITPRDPAEPVILRGRVEIGVCNEICVPAELEISARLEGGGVNDRQIRSALADRPLSAHEADLSAVSCKVAPTRDGLRLSARLTLPPLGAHETVVFESGPDIWVDESHASRQGRDLLAEAEMIADDREPFALNRSALTITVLGDGRALEIKGCPAP